MNSDLVVVNGWDLAGMGTDETSGVPAISAEMQRMVEFFNERGRQYRMPEVTPALREEALRLLPLVRMAAARKSEAAIRSWLVPINAAVAKPLAQKEFAVKAEAIAEALSDLPMACFTREMRGQVLQTAVWWPSGAEIRAKLVGRGSAVLGTLRAMEAFARPAASPAMALAHDKGTRPESQAERDRIVERFHGQLRQPAPVDRKDAARPRHENDPGSGFMDAKAAFDPDRLVGRGDPEGAK